MRPVSGNGRRSFFAETYLLPNLYNANKLPDLYLVVLSQPVLNIHMISCLSAAPQGRKRKGAVCAVLVCGGSREKLGEILLPSCSFSDCCHFLPFCLCLSLLVLSCILYCLALPGSFLVFPVRCLFLPAGIACICRLPLFLV